MNPESFFFFYIIGIAQLSGVFGVVTTLRA